MTIDAQDPIFLTVLADYDGFARWTTVLRNHDTGDKPIQVLIVLDRDGGITLATRPHSDCTWSPPIETLRR